MLSKKAEYFHELGELLIESLMIIVDELITIA